MSGDTPLIQARDLSAVFDVSKPWLNRMLAMEQKRFLTAVDTVDFDIPKGKTFALVGESGSGKSTIGRMIVGLQKPTTGQVLIDGQNLFSITNEKQKLAMRRRIQMIFQSPYASLNPRWRVKHIIGEPVRAFNLLPSGEIDKRVEELLDQVGLAKSDGEKFPHEFSGGQRQRIAIARALASNPEFIVCDEPTSALDVSVQSQVLNLMKALQRELGLTYLFISHDLSVIRYMADQIGVLYLGRLVEVADRDTLFDNPRHPYTRMLMDAAPHIDAFGRTAEIVSGEIPDPINKPSGCSFHPRCELTADQCRRERPEVRVFGPEKARVACHLCTA
ncbi:peptide/nickel transport system ATP-binding protein [Roseibium hamelinense]|uniref:Peptide/nickel transport system ATP-binding protein n=1 Tax=Roseibium hamelinense TaxID=150831 RepID=A0A562SZE8_9HYPH|nr:oligopeptide/dipeptide ABC transporter ATP-binding protein [Roseibium hamelinense]MTI44754.1 ATP-binding cassette domain-containing protein [Roseibium hamelinense]TWI86060.1 peptide/nickel transport system ATP-binding protein [Roseibium hamelinense]